MKVNRYYTEGCSSNTQIEYRFDQSFCDTCMIVDELELRLWNHRLMIAEFMQSRGCLNTYLEDRRFDLSQGKKVTPSVYDRQSYFGFSALKEWNRRWKRTYIKIKAYIKILKERNNDRR